MFLLRRLFAWNNQKPMEFEKGEQRGLFHPCPHSDQVFFHSYQQLSLPSHPKRPIHILLPAEYEHSTNRYPVIYFNDGQRAFWVDDPRDRCWEAQYQMTHFFKEKRSQKVILVAIPCGDRDAEYTHCRALLPQGEGGWEDPGNFKFPGGLDDYTKFLGDVKDWVDRNYRTLPEPQHTTIMGASHGGLAAFYTATRSPEKFGNAGCYSSSFWLAVDSPLVLFDEQSFPPNPITSLRHSKLINDVSQVLQDGKVRFWFSWGLKREGGDHNNTIERLATERTKELIEIFKDEPYKLEENKDFFWMEDPVGGHEDPAWSHQFYQMLRAFFQSS